MIYLFLFLRDFEVDFKRFFSVVMYVKVNLLKIEEVNIYIMIVIFKIKIIIIVKKEKYFC